MEILDPTAAVTFVVDEDLLNFTLDAEDSTPNVSAAGASSSSPTATTPFSQDTAASFPEFEEDLEWLSNKDAFPPVETCFDILNENTGFILKHESPVSVLENSSSSSSYNSSGSGNVSVIPSCFVSLKVPKNFPVRARSKRRRRTSGFGELPMQQWSSSRVIAKTKQTASAVGVIGRRCLHCQTDKTPQWRAGPLGPKTLCNACGVRYKSGRLLPEYRPASSPTFSSGLHSNSHRKVVEMRKKQQQPPVDGGMVMNEACGYMAG